jgi:hypothetical protein
LVVLVGLSLVRAIGLVARGAITVDTGLGRRRRPLGPIEDYIEADRDVVYDVVAAPYLKKTPRAMEGKLHVLERGDDLVLAEHYTKVGRRTTVTVETVRFERPHQVSFRLVRGPVPEVNETFELRPEGDGTQFTYTGVMGTDLWGIGALWGRMVGRQWEQTVRASIESIKEEAERRERHHPSR